MILANKHVMKKIFALLPLLSLVLSCSDAGRTDDFAALNEQAAREYLVPVPWS